MPTLLDTGSYAVQLLQATGALIVVCVLAFILLRFAARSGLGSGQNRLIHVVERVALSPRQAVAVVRVGKQYVLVGASDGGITHLRDLEADEIEEALSTEQSAKFSDMFKRMAA